MSTYEPGTIAVATVRGVPNVRVMFHKTGWWLSSESHDHEDWHGDDVVTDVRPLVTLDLDAAYGCWAEKRDPAVIVERLRETRSVAALAIADQIEAQTKPPKPDEPSATTALVRDSNGDVWARTAWGLWDDLTGESRTRKWDDIDAVKVLREGVSDV